MASTNVMIAEAVHNEYGKYQGGAAGDQTGDEVRIRKWYNRPWGVVLRFTNPAMAERFAYAMEAAARNNRIGYDQGQRNTALAAARAVGYDPARITKDCETDCSALVTLACIYAGVPEAQLFKWGNSATTSTLRSRLLATGVVKAYSGKDYVGKLDKLMRGDILLYEGHHVAGVVQGAAASLKSVHDVALECIHGKWGDGVERMDRLKAAGYDAEAIRKEVNRIVKGE